jgi:hypothetical protein
LLDSFISTQDNLKKIDDKHLALLTKFAAPENTSLPIIAEALYRKIISSDKALEFLKSLDRGDKIRDYATKPASIDFLKEYFKNPDSPALTDKLLEMASKKLIDDQEYGTGDGGAKKSAEQKAAKRACEKVFEAK